VTLRTTLPHASRVGDAGGGQAAHHGGRVLDVHEVQLEILAGRDVRDAIRIFLRDVGQRLELLRIQAAERDLDALHAGRVPHGIGALGQRSRGVGQLLGFAAVPALAVVVALAVDAAPQAGLREHLLFDLALLAQLDLRLVNIYLARQIRGHRSVQRLPP